MAWSHEDITRWMKVAVEQRIRSRLADHSEWDVAILKGDVSAQLGQWARAAADRHRWGFTISGTHYWLVVCLPDDEDPKVTNPHETLLPRSSADADAIVKVAHRLVASVRQWRPGTTGWGVIKGAQADITAINHRVHALRDSEREQETKAKIEANLAAPVVPPYTPAPRTFRAEVLEACFQSKVIAEAKLKKIVKNLEVENRRERWMTCDPVVWWSSYIVVLEDLIATLIARDPAKDRPATEKLYGKSAVREWVEAHARKITGLTVSGHQAAAIALVRAKDKILDADPAPENVIEFPRAADTTT